MPSKSQIYGQADIWDLSDYFGGSEWKTSFKYYKPAPWVTSKLYPVITVNDFTLTAAAKQIFTWTPPVDPWALGANVTFFSQRESIQTATSPDQSWTMPAPVVVQLTITTQGPILVTTPEQMWTVSATVSNFSQAVKLITYTNAAFPEQWTLTTTIAQVTIT